MTKILRGVFAASMSVLKADLSLDIPETIRHAKENLDNNGVGSAFFGSTGCGQLISVSEKKDFISALSKTNFNEQILIGTACNSLNETINQQKHQMTNLLEEMKENKQTLEGMALKGQIVELNILIPLPPGRIPAKKGQSIKTISTDGDGAGCKLMINDGKITITDGGNGYSKLPTLTITSTSGTGAKLLANTTDIGRANGIEIKDSSFDLDSSNPPDVTFKANFIVKDPSGTFASGNTLTTHTGTVSGYDSDTQVLSTTFENVVRTKGQPSSTVNEGIRLEDNSESEPHGILLEDELDFDDGENFLTNATSITTPVSYTHLTLPTNREV